MDRVKLSRFTDVWALAYNKLTFLSSGREADHSPPTTAEVKKMWVYTFTPSYAFMA
jgi:hypothetical protein